MVYWPGLNDLFVSQITIESYESHSPEWILGCACIICSYGQISFFLHNSRWIAFPTHLCLIFFLHEFPSFTYYRINGRVSVTHAILLCSIIVTHWEIFTPGLVHGFSLEFEWQQVSSSCCMLTSALARHAIPKTAEVAYSVGVRRAWLTIWDTVKIPRYSHKLMYRKRMTCELHDSYFRSMMTKTCHSKDSGSCIFPWPFMGWDCVVVELLYNPGEDRKSGSWGSDELERRCWIEEHDPERLGPQAPGWAAQQNGKETRL